MKRIIPALALIGWSVASSAADYGIGVSAKSNDGWIYAPIDFGSGVRIEPSIRYTRSRSTSLYEDDSFFGEHSQDRSRSDAHQLEYGLGFFKVSAIGEALSVYYGLRASYIDGGTKQTFTSSTEFFEDTRIDRQDFDGYRLAPTIGFEYAFNTHFSLGLEAAWSYEDSDGSTERATENSDAPRDIDFTQSFSQTANHTDTYAILRYRF
jgi:hypothetical protein